MILKNGNKVSFDDRFFDTRGFSFNVKVPIRLEKFRAIIMAQVEVWIVHLKTNQEYVTKESNRSILYSEKELATLNATVPTNVVECLMEENIDFICQVKNIAPDSHAVYVSMPYVAKSPTADVEVYEGAYSRTYMYGDIKHIIECINDRISDLYAFYFPKGVIKVQDGNILKNYFTNTAKKPLLLNFSGSTCGPCNAIAADLNAFAEKMKEHFTTVKIQCGSMDSVTAPEFFYSLSTQYKVRGLPTFILFDKEVKIGEWVGGSSHYQNMKAQLERMFNTETVPFDALK